MKTILPGKSLPFCTHRYALFVSYIGTRYQGSQRQTARDSTVAERKGGITIQEAIDVALEDHFPKSKVRTTGASRTDRGVHALMNVFTLPLQEIVYSTEKLKLMVNQSLLQRDHEIIVNDVLLMPSDFHPRVQTTDREYIYRIGVLKEEKFSELNSTFLQRQRSNQYLPITELYRMMVVPNLNTEKLQEVANLLQGEHNFGSFTSRMRDLSKAVRKLEISYSFSEMNWIQGSISHVCSLRFKSSGFLYQQIRKMVGCMLAYATYEKIGIADIRKLLEQPRADKFCGRDGLVIAEPWGLYLSKISYNLDDLQTPIKSTSFDDRETIYECCDGLIVPKVNGTVINNDTN